MGWMRYLLLGDFGQQMDIEEMRNRLDQMRSEKAPIETTHEKQLIALQHETHDLRLRLGVLIKLLISKNLLTAEEIASMIATLEPEDNVPTG